MTSPALASNHTAPNPPAVLSAAQRHELARQFERAKQLAGKAPPDYRGVHRVLSECCTLDPGNTLFAAALLENLQRAQGKTATAWFWQVSQRRAQFVEAIRNKQWGQALANGWWLLGERPRDASALGQLADVCAALDHQQTQIQLLQAAQQLEPRNIAILRPLAIALGVAGQFAGAAKAWNELRTILPDDAEATKYLQVLSKPTSAKTHAAGLAEQIVALLKQHEWDAAEQLLSAQAGAAGANLELRELGEEIMLGRARERTEIARQLAGISSTAPQQRLVTELTEEQRRIELGIAFARYERFSAEPTASWELAGCLTRAGNFSEALKYLEPLKSLPEWRLRAFLAAAENWQHLRQFDRALQNYQDALQAENLDPSDGSLQRGWFRGAVLAEAMGQPAVALGWLERLLAANPGYKDASARLDNLRLICNKGGFSAGQ